MSDKTKPIRKLSAILSADVKGYSVLMADDEIHTIDTLKSYRQIISDLISEHSGRVVDSPGDNILAEFRSSVDAVECAVKIQKRLKQENSKFPDVKKVQFRIGVNVGDVIQDGEQIYGNGVNVAARIEGMADAGGVCLSRNAYDHVRNKLNLGYEYLGEHSVKNIKTPVRVYKLLMADEDAGKLIGDVPKRVPKNWIWATVVVAAVTVAVIATLVYQNLSKPDFEPALVEKMAYTLPDKPSIVVLPFDNMSGDPKQEYFSDGITEELITAISKSPKIFIVARNSAFTYKGKAVKVSQVAEELGVQYVLEGSVRKEGDRVRITAQLIDALKGNHLWAERYDRDFKDIFALQDEITIKITGALRLELTDGELARLHARGTENLDAYQKLLQARDTLYTFTPESLKQARHLIEEAIVLDSEYALAYVYLGATHWLEISLGSSKSTKKSFERAFEYIIKAKTLDDSLPGAHSHLGWLYVMSGQYDKAIAECERAIDLAPNSANTNIWMGVALRNAGKQEEAVQYLEMALRLDPFPPPYYFRIIGSTYSWIDRHEEAIDFIKKAIERAPNDLLSHVWLTIAYSWAGKIEEARKQAEEILRINPKYSLEQTSKGFRYKNKEDQERFYNTLREAGVPDKPPLPLPDKPSIAVLAFDNMSGDPEQEYFSDGLSEEIISALSKTDQLFVIARNSSFTYKGKPVNVKQISRELGVRYVLEGSVRRSEDRVRITAQLIDATTGHHLWSERYDRNLKNIFAVQDEITKNIVVALRVKLTEGDRVRVFSRSTNSLDAYLKAMKGLHHVLRWNKNDLEIGRELYEEAIAIDPNFSGAYTLLAWTYRHEAAFGWTKTPGKSYEKAIELAKKALSMNPTDSVAHMVLGLVFVSLGKLEEAIVETKKAIAQSPNDAEVNAVAGNVFSYVGMDAESIESYEKAIKVNPINNFYYAGLTSSLFRFGDYKKTITIAKEAIKRKQFIFNTAYVHLIASYILLGREEEARAAAAELLKVDPDFSLAKWTEIVSSLSVHPKFQASTKRAAEAASQAGLK